MVSIVQASLRLHWQHKRNLSTQSETHIKRRSELVKDLGYRVLTPDHQTAYEKSLYLFYSLKKTHFTFHHGQPSSRFLGLNLLKKKLAGAHDDSKDACCMRHPADLQQLDPRIHTVDWYTSRIRPRTIDSHNDKIYRNALIAVDAHLASRTFAESALCFFSSDSFNFTSADVREHSFKQLLQYYNADSKTQQIASDYFNRLDSLLGAGSILYTICVPKANFHHCGYLSLPFGIPYTTDEAESLLEKMQNEELPTDPEPKVAEFPQVRLLPLHFESNQVKCFMFSTVSDQTIDEITKKVEELSLIIKN